MLYDGLPRAGDLYNSRHPGRKFGDEPTRRGDPFRRDRRLAIGWFSKFSEQNGGFPVFSFAITEAHMETNPDTGQAVLTQGFERNAWRSMPRIRPPLNCPKAKAGGLHLARLCGLVRKAG
jgi:hypothetical protein